MLEHSKACQNKGCPYYLFGKECEAAEGCAGYEGISYDGEGEMLNPYGEYVLKFAENHGISIAEAYEQPMVKARYDFFCKTGM